MFERTKATQAAKAAAQKPEPKAEGKVKTTDHTSNYTTATPDGAIIARIITYFTTGKSPASLSEKNVSITPEQLNDFRNQIRTGRISSDDLATFLSKIDTSSLDPKIQFHKIANNLHEKQILAVMSGYSRKNWQKISVKDLEAFLDSSPKDHPTYATPIAFTSLRDQFLDEIRPAASDEQFAIYQSAMDSLARTLYGRRFDYYEQFELLRDNTLKKSAPEPSTAEPLDKDPETLSNQTPEPLAPPLTINTANPESSNHLAAINLTSISSEQSEQILNRCLFEGDPWMQDGQEYHLAASNLLTAGLGPTHGFSFNNQPFYLSNPFALADGNTAILAYLPIGRDVKVRSYYYDLPTALWHYLPDYIRQNDGNGFGWYGESYAPEATILPHRLQQILSALMESQDTQQITNTNPDFLFAGTAAAYSSRQEYRNAKNSNHLRGDFYQEVSSSPVNASVDPLSPHHRKTAPQLLSVNNQIAPNFASPSFTYSTYCSLVGQIDAVAFKANDGSCSWLFFTDYRGRVWISNLEAISPLTSTGCRRDWLYPTDLTTPLYEFSNQANNYGDPSDTRKGYTSMWNNYLSKVPLIETYIEVVQKPH